MDGRAVGTRGGIKKTIELVGSKSCVTVVEAMSVIWAFPGRASKTINGKAIVKVESEAHSAKIVIKTMRIESKDSL